MNETKVKEKKSTKEWLIEDLCNDLLLWRGMVIGIVIGYLLSYFFQSEFIRAKLGFFGYIAHAYDILFSGVAEFALPAWISMIVGAGVGVAVEKKLSSPRLKLTLR